MITAGHWKQPAPSSSIPPLKSRLRSHPDVVHHYANLLGREVRTAANRRFLKGKQLKEFHFFNLAAITTKENAVPFWMFARRFPLSAPAYFSHSPAKSRLQPPQPSVLSLIGQTPVVELSKFDTGLCRLFVKLESQNPEARSRIASRSP